MKMELLPDARPVKEPPHHLSAEDEQMIEEELGEMAANGFVERIRDPKWVFPFFVAKGKGRRKGKKRTAVDFTRLNTWLRVVNYPMSTMDDLIDSIPKGSLYISTIDGAKACLQQGVEDPEKCLTIRGPRSSCWHFKGLPLGVSAAVVLFQRQMKAIIAEDLIAAGDRVYLDDIIVLSRTRHDHLALLDKVFESMLAAGMKIRLSRCSFMQNEVEYLGYNLSGEGIEVAPERIQALIDAPAPANGSGVRVLLGGLVMLRRFDHQIAEKTVFLNSLINSFNWGGE